MPLPSRCALLSTAYFGPVQYYSKFISHPETIIEKHENYPKQSYRNRCRILAANGPLSLVIPVKKEAPKTPLARIRIDFDTDWQKLHWRSLESAYRSAPFFEFYVDDILDFYQERHTHLFEMNMAIHGIICGWLSIPQGKISTSYVHPIQAKCQDYRDNIHPKKQRNVHDPFFKPAPYPQVFSDKFPFQPNLSILDLIFNEGPNASAIIKQSIPRVE